MKARMTLVAACLFLVLPSISFGQETLEQRVTRLEGEMRLLQGSLRRVITQNAKLRKQIARLEKGGEQPQETVEPQADKPGPKPKLPANKPLTEEQRARLAQYREQLKKAAGGNVGVELKCRLALATQLATYGHAAPCLAELKRAVPLVKAAWKIGMHRTTTQYFLRTSLGMGKQFHARWQAPEVAEAIYNLISDMLVSDMLLADSPSRMRRGLPKNFATMGNLYLMAQTWDSLAAGTKKLHHMKAAVKFYRAVGAKNAGYPQAGQRIRELETELATYRKGGKKPQEVAEPEAPKSGLPANKPLNEEQRARLAQHRQRLKKALAAKRGEPWHDAVLEFRLTLAKALAEYGQAEPCLAELKRAVPLVNAFSQVRLRQHAENRFLSYALVIAQSFRETGMAEAIYNLAGDMLLANQKFASVGALYLMAKAWDGLTESRDNMKAAVKFYRAAVAKNPAISSAWERIRALEAALGKKKD